jgi:hypothetical protein
MKGFEGSKETFFKSFLGGAWGNAPQHPRAKPSGQSPTETVAAHSNTVGIIL